MYIQYRMNAHDLFIYSIPTYMMMIDKGKKMRLSFIHSLQYQLPTNTSKLFSHPSIPILPFCTLPHISKPSPLPLSYLLDTIELTILYYTPSLAAGEQKRKIPSKFVLFPLMRCNSISDPPESYLILNETFQRMHPPSKCQATDP